MADKVWGESDDGTIQYQLLTKKYLDRAIKMMTDAFFLHENVCKAVGLPEHPEAIAELDDLLVNTAKDGVSVIAIEKRSDKVIGAVFNKIQVKSAQEGSFFENFAKSCKHPQSRGVVQFMIDADNLCDLFDHCDVDCLLEITFLGTLPESRRKGIAGKLCEISLEVGKKLLKGENVKKPLEDEELSLEPVPKVAAALFTSLWSQKIGRRLGFEIAAEESFEKFEFEGRTYANVIGQGTPSMTLEYKRLG